MIPALLNLIIIRLSWIKKNNIIIKPTTDILIINSYGLTISIKTTPISLEIKELITAPFAILIKGPENAKNRLRYLKHR